MSSTQSTDTRSAILGAARTLLERDGYHAVGLAAVAKEAGVSRQAIYLHFGSKAKLLEALISALQQEYVVPVFERHGVWESASGLDALDAWVEVNALTVPPILAVANAVDVARRSDAEAQATWEMPDDSRYEGCVRIARWLKDDGVLAPGWTVPDAAALLWSLTSIRGFEDLTRRGWSASRYMKHIRRTARAALTAAPE